MIEHWRWRFRYEEVEPNGSQIDVTGNTSAKRGVVFVYDIFGYYPQTLKGADRLSEHLDAVTLVPDLFEGAQAYVEWLPMDTEEKKSAFGKFYTEVASPPKNVEKLLKVVAEAKAKYPSVEKWAIIGLCWGGKVCTDLLKRKPF